MGAARKLREQEKPVQLTPLRTSDEGRNNHIKSFITLIIVIITLFTVFSIFFNNHENKEETLEEFVERVKKERPKKPERFIIGQIPEELVLKINDIAKQSIKGYQFGIQAEKIVHIENRHGRGNEKLEGQIPVEIEHYNELVKTLYHPDAIELVWKAKNGALQLKFNRIPDLEYIVFVQISNKKKVLDVNTFYIKKAVNNY